MGKVKSLSFSGGASVTAPTDLTTTSDQNAIINGNFDFWQRGNATTAVTTYTYLADRWMCSESTDGTATIERSTDVPSSSDTKFPATYSLLYTVTGADASIGATQNASIRQNIEGYNWAPFHGGQNIVLSFWVKSSLTGTFCVGIKNSAGNRAIVKEYTISSANTWERKTITLATDTAGTWLADNSVGAAVLWTLAAGSDFQTTAGAWAAGNYFATSNQANLFSSTHTFRLAQVMLHKGTAAETFCRAAPTIQQERQLCERYYEKSYSIDTVPGTNTAVNYFNRVDFASNATTTTGISHEFRVPKRSDTVTATTYAQDGTAGNLNGYGVTIGSFEVAATATNVDANRFVTYFNGTMSGATTGQCIQQCGHWTAECEL